MDVLVALLDQVFNRYLALLPIMVIAVGALELIIPLRKVPIQHYGFNVLYSFVSHIIFTAIAMLMAVFVAIVVTGLVLGLGQGYGWIDLGALSVDGIGGALLTLFVSAVIFDFFFYWMHRYQHHNKVLWQEHIVHHSDESMNVSTGSRSHFLDAILQSIFIGLPMVILFKLPPVTIAWLALVPFAWTYFIHANLKLHFGPLWWLLVSPDYHRIHHSIEKRHADKNFASWFPIWDIMFGTLVRPQPGQYPATGVAGVSIQSVQQALAFPFVAWGRMLRAKLSGKTPVAAPGPGSRKRTNRVARASQAANDRPRR